MNGSAAAAAVAAVEAAAAGRAGRFGREAAAAGLGVLLNAAATRAGADAVGRLGGLEAAVRAAPVVMGSDGEGRQRACGLLFRLASGRADNLRILRAAAEDGGALGQVLQGSGEGSRLGPDRCAVLRHVLRGPPGPTGAR
jgi:hypothetical protein